MPLYNNLGPVYFAQNTEERRLLPQGHRPQERQASFHVNLGTLYFESKRGAKGLEEWRKALTLDPDILKKTEGLSVSATSSQKNASETNYLMARLFASMGNAELAVQNCSGAHQRFHGPQASTRNTTSIRYEKTKSSSRS
jgi:hypothetical protein